MSDDPYKSFDHHIRAQDAEIARLRATISQIMTPGDNYKRLNAALATARREGMEEAADRIDALQKRVADLEGALITAQNTLSEMGISSAEKCQMAYDYLREANAALGGKDE